MRKGWTETTLGELVKIQKGKKPPALDVREEASHPYLTADVLRGATCEQFVSYALTGLCIQLSGRETVLLWDGAGAGDVFKSQPGILASTMAKLEARDSLAMDDGYLYLYLNFKQVTIKSSCRGTTVPHVSPEALKALYVSIPPLAEQKRIVNVVSSLDAYVDALQQQADSARTARNAVLHELLSAGGDNWTETTLGKISQLVSRGRAPSYCDDDGVVVLNQKCVRYGRIFFEFARRTDSTKKTIPEWAYLKVGDTLINSTGVGTLGRASFVSCLDGPTTFDSHVTLVRPRHDSSFPEFIGMTLNLLENEIEMFAGGSTGQTELSREAVNSFPVSLPPLEEQKRIVEIVSSMDDVIQATEQSVVNARNLRSGLLSDLLSGEHEIPKSFDKFFGTA